MVRYAHTSMIQSLEQWAGANKRHFVVRHAVLDTVCGAGGSLGKASPAQVGHESFSHWKYYLSKLQNSPSTGFYSALAVSPRPLPSLDDTTQETVHPSVLEQDKLPLRLKEHLSEHPELIHQLRPLEEEWKRRWPYNPDSAQAQDYKLSQANQTLEQWRLRRKRWRRGAV